MNSSASRTLKNLSISLTAMLFGVTSLHALAAEPVKPAEPKAKMEQVKAKTVQAKSEASDKQAERLNLNTATEQQLTMLPGVGAKKAKAIIEFREQIGGFKDVAQLKEVKGIGDKLFAKLADKVQL